LEITTSLAMHALKAKGSRNGRYTTWCC